MGTKIDVGSTVTSRLRLFYRNTELGVGTGFFTKYGSQLYLITNWHVVSGRNFQTREHLSKELALPDRLKYTAGCRGHLGEWMDVDCMLYEDSESSEQPENPVWLEHAAHGYGVDVVAIPITLPEDAEVSTIDRVNTVPRMRITVSRDVFVIGYPKGISGYRGFPIWKRASIANEPDIQHDGLPKLLVDTATREGMSGAPVVAIADGEFDVEGMSPPYRPPGRVYRFIGVYSGRLGKGEMEAQLGIVWKAQAIDEIVQVPTRGKSSFLI
jgi:hypothetical protein